MLNHHQCHVLAFRQIIVVIVVIIMMYTHTHTHTILTASFQVSLGYFTLPAGWAVVIVYSTEAGSVGPMLKGLG